MQYRLITIVGCWQKAHARRNAIGASQGHTGTDPQTLGGGRNIDDTPRLVGPTCAGANDKRNPAQCWVKRLFQGTVKATYTHMHYALTKTCQFSSARSLLEICWQARKLSSVRRATRG